MRLIMMGFGNVGQGFAEILIDRADRLREQHGLEIQLVGVATRSRGMLYHPDGLSIAALLAAVGKGSFDHYPEQDGLRRDFADPLALVQNGAADVLVEVSPTKLEDGQPAREYIETALTSGKHVVTANKGPIALAYPALRQMAHEQGRQLRFEATVMAGTPALATGLELLSGSAILEARGILNGTCNYILTEMEGGLSYEAALTQAQELGYAETDPTADVEGWDAASKVLILLAALFNRPIPLAELSVSGITGISQKDIAEARAAGERYKLVASVTRDGGQVEPVRLALSDPLAHVNGATNAITFTTDLMGDITLIGAGAGRLETGFALLADLLAIQRLTSA